MELSRRAIQCEGNTILPVLPGNRYQTPPERAQLNKLLTHVQTDDNVGIQTTYISWDAFDQLLLIPISTLSILPARLHTVSSGFIQD